MEDFIRILSHASKSFSVNVPDNILLKIKSCGEHLNLTCCNLTVELCKAFGKALAVDHFFTSVSFGDCMLSEEGLSAIVNGLCENTKVRSLDLKGNNIRGHGTEYISKLLRHNSVIENLVLEWNMLGLLPEIFQKIAESLIGNQTLQRLDLRNNQISPQVAAVLCSALHSNNSIVELDLRWNNCGLIGGRKLLECLKVNRTLLAIHLSGNGIPSEILHSIERAIQSNVEKKNLVAEYSQKTWEIMEENYRHLKDNNNTQIRFSAGRVVILSDGMSAYWTERNLKIKNLAPCLDDNKDESSNTKIMHSLRIKQLRDALIERKTAIASLTAKVEALQMSMRLVEEKNRDLSEVLGKLQGEKLSMHDEFHKLLIAEREEHSIKETHLLEEIAALGKIVQQLEKEVEHYKREAIAREKEVENAEMKLHSQEQKFNDKLKRLQLKNDAKVQEIEERKNSEVKQLEDSTDLMSSEMSMRLMKVEDDKIQLQEELNRLNRSIFMQKSQFEELLNHQRLQLRNEESQKISCLEEELQIAHEHRKKQENQIVQQLEKIKEMQAKNSQLDLQHQNLKFSLGELQQELNGKDEEIKLAVAKVKLEVKSQLEELAILRDANRTLTMENQQKENKIIELQRGMEQEVSSHNIDLERLMHQLGEERRKSQLRQEDEARRASNLQEAFLSYLSGIKKSS